MNHDLNDIQLACFSLDDNIFAVDIMRIREILLPQRLSGLPKASEVFEGVINLRGTVIPVMDLRKLFGMHPLPDGKVGKLLIVSLARQVLALAVDNVMEVISIPAEEITPPLDTGDEVGMEHILGVCLSQGRVVMILNIDTLISHGDIRETSPVAVSI